MKRAGLLLIVTTMLFLTACGAKDPIVGKWHATVLYDGTDFIKYDAAAQENIWSIFDNDGTGSQSINGSTYSLTWELYKEEENSRSYTVTVDGLSLYFALSRDSASEPYSKAILFVEEDWCIFYEK